MIYRVQEGQLLRQGLNWNKSETSRFRCILCIWRLQLYFRWRSKLVGGKRIILDICYTGGRWVVKPGRFDIEMNSLAVMVDGECFSYEFLSDMVYSSPGSVLVKTEKGWKR